MAENLTFANATSQNLTQSHWKTFLAMRICEGATVTLFLVTVWILTNMIEYGKRKNKWNINKNEGKVYLSCFIGIATSVPRLIVDFLLYHIPNGDDSCAVFNIIIITLHTLSAVSVYFFLWFRQYTVTSNKKIKSLIPQWVHNFSVFVLIFDVTIMPSIIFLFSLTLEPFHNGFGCSVRYCSSPYCLNLGGFEFILLISTLFQQVSATTLFIYPMMRLKMSGNEGRSTQGRTPRNKLLSKVKRYLLSAVYVFVSDVISGIIAGIPFSPFLSIYHRINFSTNFAINHICMLASYENCTHILTTICRPDNSVLNAKSDAISYKVAKRTENPT